MQSPRPVALSDIWQTLKRDLLERRNGERETPFLVEFESFSDGFLLSNAGEQLRLKTKGSHVVLLLQRLD